MIFSYKLLDGTTVEADVSPNVATFFERMVALRDDADVTEDKLLDPLFSKANPILDVTTFRHNDRGAVTGAVVKHPLYPVLADMVARKQNQQDRVRSPPILRVRIGSAPGVSFRIRGAMVAGSKEGPVRTGEIVDWTRIAILSSVNGAGEQRSSARLWVIEPDPGAEEDAEIVFRSFFVRGRFRIVEQDNHEKRARAAFAVWGR